MVKVVFQPEEILMTAIFWDNRFKRFPQRPAPTECLASGSDDWVLQRHTAIAEIDPDDLRRLARAMGGRGATLTLAFTDKRGDQYRTIDGQPLQRLIWGDEHSSGDCSCSDWNRCCR